MSTFKLSSIVGRKKKASAYQDLSTPTQNNNDDNDCNDDVVEVIISPIRSPSKRGPGGRKGSEGGAGTKHVAFLTPPKTGQSSSQATGAGDDHGHDEDDNNGIEIKQDVAKPPAFDFDIQVKSMRTIRQPLNDSMMTTMDQGFEIPGGPNTPPGSSSDYMALCLIGFSAFVYSLQTLNVKLLGGHFDSFTTTFFRGIIGSLLCFIHTWYDGQNTGTLLLGKPENFRLLVLRGILGGVTIASAFYAVTALDLAEASVLIFMAPLWTAVLSKIYGISEWGYVDTAAAFCCITGMILVTQPPIFFAPSIDENRPFALLLPGILAAVISAISAAGVNITIKKLKGEEPSTITLYAMLGSIVVALPGFYYHQISANGSGVLWTSPITAIAQLCLTGCLSWLAQMSKTTGLQLSKTMGVLVMRYLDIIFCYIWDIAFLHVVADAVSTAGAMIIIGGCLTPILTKRSG